MGLVGGGRRHTVFPSGKVETRLGHAPVLIIVPAEKPVDEVEGLLVDLLVGAGLKGLDLIQT